MKPLRSGAISPRMPRDFRIASVMRQVESVASISGAPRIAPTPISSLSARLAEPPSTAMIGTVVSGSAVPTAAKSDPVTPSDMPEFARRDVRARS